MVRSLEGAKVWGVMKTLLHRILLLLIGVFIGFALGRGSAPKPNPGELRAVAVDCYDSAGKLVSDPFWDKMGVKVSCAPGQTAKLHQPPPQ